MQPNTGLLHISDETTQPLPLATSPAFQKYLDDHALNILDVAHAAHVRLLVIWNILHDKPVLPADAGKVRSGLFLLTKERYYGPIPVRLHEERSQKGDFTQSFARV
jgi:hypothetical protein